MVTLENCPEDKPWVLHHNDNPLWSLVIENAIQFDYIRLQIAKGEYEGYYLVNPSDERKKYPINKYGVVYPYPDGMFDVGMNLSSEILHTAMEHRSKELKNEDTLY